MIDYGAYDFDEGPLKALGLKVLHGANYFSGGKVVIVRLDLGEFDEVFTNEIPGFYEKLTKALPSLHEHHCSVGCVGGFFQRIERGTLLGHVTEHVAIEVQTLAGMDVAYGKTRATASAGVYNVVFRFIDEEAGLYAAKAAVNLVNALLVDRPFDVGRAVEQIVAIREERLLGPSTQAIVEAAKERGIPFIRLDEHNLVQLGDGKYQKRIRATITEETGLIPVETAANKYLTVRMLEAAGVPVPETIKASSAAKILAFYEEAQAPLVVKPCVGNLGHGVSLNLASSAAIDKAVGRALAVDDEIVAQPHIEGDTFRLLVVDFKFVAAVRLTPPAVIGDGVRTIAQLVDELNADPRRAVGDKTCLTRIELDGSTAAILEDGGLDFEAILPLGRKLELKVSRSLKIGGASEDVTDLVHPANRALAERASRNIGLNVAGIDIVAPSISEPIVESAGVVVGVSAAPDFRMHLMPAAGQSRSVADPFVDMLFQPGAKARVPIVAITGTRGKTIAARLLDHCLSRSGRRVGLACAEGLFVAGEALIKGDMTRLESTAITLGDRSIDCAVVEVPLETILEEGLGYESADCGIVLNVDDEGKKYDELRNLEDVAYAKSVVAEQVYDEGFTVLNADSDLVLAMRERLYSQLALFSRSDQNRAVKEHTDGGGLAVTVDGDYVIIRHDRQRTDLIHLDDIPLCARDGEADHLDALLATVAALCVIDGRADDGVISFSADALRESLASFA